MRGLNFQLWDLKDRPLPGDYRVGRVVEVLTYRRLERNYVRIVKVAILARGETSMDSRVQIVLRDMSNIALIEGHRN